MFDLTRYTFFIYKTSLNGYRGEDFFGGYHIAFMALALVAVVALALRCRRWPKQRVRRFLIVLSVLLPLLEVVKIGWETYWDLSNGTGFNWVGVLPLYTCSLMMYVLPPAVWGHGKVQEACLGFLSTLCIFSGLTNFFMPPILNVYPFFTFAVFLSLNYHFLMVLTGVLLLVTGYYRPTRPRQALLAWTPVVCLSAVAIPANLLIQRLVDCGGGPGPDYMLYLYGAGAPLLPQLADFFRSLGMPVIYGLLVMLLYGGITAAMVALYRFLFSRSRPKGAPPHG